MIIYKFKGEEQTKYHKFQNDEDSVVILRFIQNEMKSPFDRLSENCSISISSYSSKEATIDKSEPLQWFSTILSSQQSEMKGNDEYFQEMSKGIKLILDEFRNREDSGLEMAVFRVPEKNRLLYNCLKLEDITVTSLLIFKEKYVHLDYIGYSLCVPGLQ